MSREARLMALVNAALAWERDVFESDSPISGADLVDWFARWRLSVQAAVFGAPDPFFSARTEEPEA